MIYLNSYIFLVLFFVIYFLWFNFSFSFIFLDDEEACDLSLLSLLPLSWIVAPIRELANITHLTTAIANISNNLTPNSDINMVINPEDNIYNIGNSFKKRRGRSLLFSMYKLRSSSIFSSKYSEDYHVHVKRDSDKVDEDDPVSSIGSIKIEYSSQGRQKN